MKPILLLTSLLSFTLSIAAQDCSVASMVSSPGPTSGSCDSSTALYTHIPTTITKNFTDTCSGTAGAAAYANKQYYSVQSTVKGNGECESFPTHIVNCPPNMTNSIVQASGSTGGWLFHNQAADQRVGFDPNGNAICVPVDGGTRDDPQQCQGQPCAGGGGSGGGCTPNPGTIQGAGPVGYFVQSDPNNPPPPCTVSPIIIDTEGQGFHLTSADAGVTFDITGTGHPTQMGWTDVRFRNAFLALPGSDGLVHNGKQLFGNFTPQPPSPSPNGFLALAEFDKPENGGNGDGIIDEKDAVYSKLRLWIDENHDGVCQPNELYRLQDLEVYSLALNYVESRRTDQFGDQFRYRARVDPGERRDPRDTTPTGDPGRWAYDVFFVTK